MNDIDILNIKLSISLNRRLRVSSHSHPSSETLERFSFKINIHSLAELNPRPLPVPNSNLLIFHSRNEIFQKPTSFESPPSPRIIWKKSKYTKYSRSISAYTDNMSPLPASEEAIRLRSTISVPPWKRRRADCRCTERPDNGWTMQTVSTVNGYDGDALNRWFPWCHITRKRCLSTLDNRPVTIHPPRDDLSPSLPPSLSLPPSSAPPVFEHGLYGGC